LEGEVEWSIMNLDESRYRGENGECGRRARRDNRGWGRFAIGQTGNMTKKRKEKMKLVIMTLNFRSSATLMPRS
jgi:hypothetical protein